MIVYEENPINITGKHDSVVTRKSDSVIKNISIKDPDKHKSDENKVVESNINKIEAVYKSLLNDEITVGKDLLKKNDLGNVYHNVQALPKVTEPSSSSFSPLNSYLKSLQSPLLKKVSHIFWYRFQ